ncbi:ERI1 exoribonuclease 2 [Notolabrus celidotus]|uniref:ERI1 exoribonuclease 2 n=1 Tax=Notolabrus celidotus TaxID=1203425 RepID=UPI00148F7AB9|nr:ERI1 exoribonuclease 2 [Notolabrus celidotus]
MSTKKLAKELGLLRQRSQSSNGSKKSLTSNQTFSYLIVIDFESTCWREKNNYSQEVIEFPAVLLNTSSGEIESEFHTYVQPQEHPMLSEFCTELTGITQVQVEAGIPLQICLSRFSRWLQKLQLERGVVFLKGQQKPSTPSQKLCTFVTWSDWDLGVCLQYECKRKQLYKPDVLNSWIDLRSTYRLFYDRKPKGLNGALQDLGIQFSGREHSGLDDSRNTAQLAARMMRDGCVMKITRSLVKTPLMVKPVFGNTTADNKKEKNSTSREENTLSTSKPSSCKIPPKLCDIKSGVQKMTKDSDTKENSGSVCQSLISPKTLLNGTAASLWGHSRRSFTAESITNISSSVMINSPHSNNSSSSSSLLLCSTTVGCLPNLPQTNRLSNTAGGDAEEEEGGEVFVETEDRCGSYDDVVVEGDSESISEREGGFDDEYVSGFDSRCHVGEEPEYTHSAGHHVTLKDNTRGRVSFSNNPATHTKTGESSATSLCANNTRSHMNDSNAFKGIGQHSTVSESSFNFAVPRPLNSKSNLHKAGLQTSAQVREKSNGSNKKSKANTPFLFRHKPFIPEKTSTPYTSFVKPKPVITQPTKHKDTPKSSFTIYTDPEKPSSSSMCGSFNTPKNALSSLSTNTLSSRTNRSLNPVTFKGGQKITSPLCACGRRAKRQVVSNGGPNQGRGFYCCPVRRSGSGGQIKKGCEFFKWESALMKSSSVSSPAVRSSVSLCQMNSTLRFGPQQRSVMRKSC